MYDDDPAFDLDDDGTRMDALAALHGIATTLLRAVRSRIAAGRGRRVVRQEKAIENLAVALASAYRGREAGPDLDWVVEAMAKADRTERNGIDHDALIDLPTDWPFPRFALNPAQMALAAILRLRHGLLRELVVRDDPRRAVQLRLVRDFEADLIKMAEAIDAETTTPIAALEWLIPRFAAGAEMIQPADLYRLLGAKPGTDDLAAAVTAVTVLTGRPDAPQ
jgi:hypothetical protein